MKSFKNEPLWLKIVVITFFSLIIIGTLSFVFAVYYFGILGIFRVLGVEYDSLSSFFLFVLFYFLLSFVAEMIEKLFKVLLTIVKVSRKQKKAVLFIVNFLISLAIISFLNIVMNSITLAPIAQVILALLIVSIETVLEGKFNRKKKKSA